MQCAEHRKYHSTNMTHPVRHLIGAASTHDLSCSLQWQCCPRAMARIATAATCDRPTVVDARRQQRSRNLRQREPVSAVASLLVHHAWRRRHRDCRHSDAELRESTQRQR